MGSPRAALLALLFALRGASAGEIAVSVAVAKSARCSSA